MWFFCHVLVSDWYKTEYSDFSRFLFSCFTHPSLDYDPANFPLCYGCNIENVLYYENMENSQYSSKNYREYLRILNSPHSSHNTKNISAFPILRVMAGIPLSYLDKNFQYKDKSYDHLIFMVRICILGKIVFVLQQSQLTSAVHRIDVSLVVEWLLYKVETILIETIRVKIFSLKTKCICHHQSCTTWFCIQ